MKKTVLFTVFTLVLCLCLALACFAEEVNADTSSTVNDGPPSPPGEGEVDIKSYIQEKIVPVAAGVLTAVIAFLATLYKIASVLKSLKEAGRAIDTEGEIRAELKEQAQALKDGLGELPNLIERVNELQEQVRVLSEILTLGFCSSKEVIESGRGKRMSILLENARCTMQNAKLEQDGAEEMANEKV